MAGFEPATSSFRTAVTPDTCIIQDTNSTDLNSARHGHFQQREKNADCYIEQFLSAKTFQQKVTITL